MLQENSCMSGIHLGFFRVISRFIRLRYTKSFLVTRPSILRIHKLDSLMALFWCVFTADSWAGHLLVVLLLIIAIVTKVAPYFIDYVHLTLLEARPKT